MSFINASIKFPSQHTPTRHEERLLSLQSAMSVWRITLEPACKNSVSKEPTTNHMPVATHWCLPQLPELNLVHASHEEWTDMNGSKVGLVHPVSNCVALHGSTFYD